MSASALGLALSILLTVALGCGGASPHETRSSSSFDVGPAAGERDVPLPDPADGGSVTLPQLLAWAHEHAPDIRIARAALLERDAARAEAGPWLVDNPTLTAAAGPRITSAGTGVDVEVSLSQSFEIGGEGGLRDELADRVGDRVEAQLAAARFVVHAQIHAGFHAALVERARLALSDRVVTFQERLLHVAQQRMQAGDVSPLVVRLAEADVAQAQQKQIQSRQRYVAAAASLAEVAGWPVEHPIEPAGELHEPRPPPPLARLVELAERHQPALAIAAARRDEAQARLSLEDREGFPEPTIGVAWAREGGPGEIENVITGSLSIPVPLFQRNQGPRARAVGEHARAVAELEALQSRVRARLSRYESAVRSAAERVAVFGTEILPSFERNLQMLERAFEIGEIDVLQVSVAVERFLQIQSDALGARADYFDALARLEQTVGTDLFADR